MVVLLEWDVLCRCIDWCFVFMMEEGVVEEVEVLLVFVLFLDVSVMKVIGVL